VFGNVREQDSLAIWESDAFRRFREDQAGREPDVPCRRCPKRLTG
jgi:MoaA/NifB/PqqE/SkfB family radical SAM enzyme